MDYDPLDQRQVPIEERLFHHRVVGTIKTVQHFPAQQAVMDDFEQLHRDYMDAVCLNILCNLSERRGLRYRIYIEARAQAAGMGISGCEKLAYGRARFLRDAFHRYLMGFRASLKGEMCSIQQYVRSHKLSVTLLDLLPFYDSERGSSSWTLGSPQEERFHRGKINVYYEAEPLFPSRDRCQPGTRLAL